MRGQSWTAILDSKGGFVTALAIIGFLIYTLGATQNSLQTGSGNSALNFGSWIITTIVIIAFIWVISKLNK